MPHPSLAAVLLAIALQSACAAAPAATTVESRAQAGDAKAMFKLGCMYVHGQGVAQNWGKAADWYEKAAQAGEPQAMYCIGFMYMQSRVREYDAERSSAWFAKAAKGLEKEAQAGDAKAMTTLSGMYGSGYGVTRNKQKSHDWLERAATAGCVDAMAELGARYRYKYYGKVDYAKGLMWTQKAADAGNAQAMMDLSAIYRTGLQSTQEVRHLEGEEDFLNRVDAGYPEKDEAKAKEWLERAAKAGAPWAMVSLGSACEEKEGGSHDYAQALVWYRKAVDAGEGLAASHIARIYEQGLGVPVDKAEALRWYEREALTGRSVGAPLRVAKMYAQGFGGTKDYIKSYAWSQNKGGFFSGEDDGEKESKRLSDEAKKYLSPEEFKRAQTEAERIKSAVKDDAYACKGFYPLP